ncbi:MAG: hypothetical protein HY363_02425 [Candidatus Aenigmarchaeota archaeon]|nr:hypothetical protein [Candidatus Aenigmarchaeota archaeon]
MVQKKDSLFDIPEKINFLGALYLYNTLPESIVRHIKEHGFELRKYKTANKKSINPQELRKIIRLAKENIKKPISSLAHAIQKEFLKNDLENKAYHYLKQDLGLE